MGSLASVKIYFDDDGFDGQLKRSIGKADSGMANEANAAIAKQITPGDRDSWYQSWAAFGSRLKYQPDAAVRGRPRSARAARTCVPPSTSGKPSSSTATIWTDRHARPPASVAAFRSALPLLSHPARVLSTPLAGVPFHPGRACRPAATILHIGGYDGTAEELYA